jgi:hypothetical protein
LFKMWKKHEVPLLLLVVLFTNKCRWFKKIEYQRPHLSTNVQFPQQFFTSTSPVVWKPRILAASVSGALGGSALLPVPESEDPAEVWN